MGPGRQLFLLLLVIVHANRRRHIPRMGFPHPVLLTGAGRAGQMGEAMARELAARGAQLVLVDRDAEEAERRASELRDEGHSAIALGADLSDAAAYDDFVVRLRDACGGRLSAAILAAGGFAANGAVAEADPALWERMLRINLWTAMLSTRAALPMLRPDGAIVYFASAAVLPGGRSAGIGAYAASKAAVIALMRAVADEERTHGVRANAVAPVAIRTQDNLRTMGENARYIEREELARIVAWLCEQPGVTGQVIGM